MRFYVAAVAVATATVGLLAAPGVLSQDVAAPAAAAAPAVAASDISSQCSTFMSGLDADRNLKPCLAPLLNATNFYAEAMSKKNPSATALTDSLGKLCGPDAGCDAGLIRIRLSEFWDNCRPEIQAKQTKVLETYDFLYLLNPFREAICTKDDGGKFCVLNIATYAAKTATTKRSVGTDDPLLAGIVRSSNEHSGVVEQLYARQEVSGDADIADVTTADSTALDSSNIAFLFLQPTAEKKVLCTSCTKNILARYIAFETSIPYAIGLANSQQLRGQSELYKAAKKTCGSDFTVGVNQIAGTTAFAEVDGAASVMLSKMAVAGFAAVVAAALAL